MLQSISPWSGELWREYPLETKESLEQKISKSFATSRDGWAAPTSWQLRFEAMKNLAVLLDKQQDDLALLAAMEMGKPISQGRAEVRKCAVAVRTYQKLLTLLMSSYPRSYHSLEGMDPNISAEVAMRPLGPILLIMPWNFPFWQVVRAAAAQIAVGNPILLKHASNTPQAAQALERIFRSIGLPPEAFQPIYLRGAEVSEVIKDVRVKGVIFTGSSGVGVEVATQCAFAMKKCVLELGGADPFVVTKSSDLNLALETALASRLLNSGQSCLNAKRFFIHESRYDEFKRGLVRKLTEIRPSDPREDSCTLGPLATKQAKQDAEDFLRRSLESGVQVTRPSPDKSFLEHPTAFLPVIFENQSLMLAREETFAPIFTLSKFNNIEDVLSELEKSPYALGATLFSRDAQEMNHFKENHASGLLSLNCQSASHPELPVGGLKSSGIGKECGLEGMSEFLRITSTLTRHA